MQWTGYNTSICYNDSDDDDFVLKEQSKKRKLDMWQTWTEYRKMAMFSASYIDSMDERTSRKTE